MSGDVIHHLYRRPGDLLPYCGVTPGRDLLTGNWNAGHGEALLLEALDFGLASCITCLSPEALGGWTPLILSDEGGDEE